MKTITTHHDGHGLNEMIQIVAVDQPGPGGAHHIYEFDVERPKFTMVGCGRLEFQKGGRNEPGSQNGVTEGAVLAVLIDRMRDFQAGPFPSEEGGIALVHLEAAMNYLKLRADKRAERGVLGSNVV